MPATHKLQITYDTATGKLAVTHRTTVEVAGHKEPISHWEHVTMADEAGTIAALKALIAENAQDMEERTARLAIRHAAAVNKDPSEGLKHLHVGGSLAARGGVEPKKG